MIKLIILDVDGVMTDGKKYYDRDGNVVTKNFCDKDWTAIKRFRAIDIPVVFLTGDPYNATILKNRNLPYVVNRGEGFHRDKVNFLDDILTEYECDAKETVYVGDDLFDMGVMKKIKYSYCPRDAPRCDTLELKGLIPFVPYDEVMEKIYELDLKEKF